jgi:hypothetical protein
VMLPTNTVLANLVKRADADSWSVWCGCSKVHL